MLFCFVCSKPDYSAFRSKLCIYIRLRCLKKVITPCALTFQAKRNFATKVIRTDMICRATLLALYLLIPHTLSATTTTAQPETTTSITPTASNDTAANDSVSSGAELLPPDLNVWDSAFFQCGARVYQNDTIDILFPPSDASMPNVTNITEGIQSFEATYSAFCGKIPEYILCVKDTLMNNPSYIDTRLDVYVDIGSMDAAFDVYCNNNNTIPSWLECTLRSLDNSSCPYGGIFGTLDLVMNAIQSGLSQQEYCRILNESIRCRVDNQLKPCDAGYAETMEFVYTALTEEYCMRQTVL